MAPQGFTLIGLLAALPHNVSADDTCSLYTADADCGNLVSTGIYDLDNFCANDDYGAYEADESCGKTTPSGYQRDANCGKPVSGLLVYDTDESCNSAEGDYTEKDDSCGKQYSSLHTCVDKDDNCGKQRTSEGYVDQDGSCQKWVKVGVKDTTDSSYGKQISKNEWDLVNGS